MGKQVSRWNRNRVVLKMIIAIASLYCLELLTLYHLTLIRLNGGPEALTRDA